MSTVIKTLLDIADAVVVKLNAGSFSKTFTAAVRDDTDLKLEDSAADSVYVDIVPGGVKIERATRDARVFDCRTDIGIRCRPTTIDMTHFRDLLAFAGEIEEFLKPSDGNCRTLTTYTDAAWIASEFRALWVPRHWHEWRQFTSIISVTYRVIG